jgi:NitT/TauT family transport system permease protein
MKQIKPIIGWLILLAIWWGVSSLELINRHVLPTPGKVWDAFVTKWEEGLLAKNVWFSLKINLSGYMIAISTAIPVGFLLGQFKTMRQLFSQLIDSLRFIPVTALGGIFIALFGLTIWTKINFLAFGIWVYLVPVVVQRIDEVSKICLQMMKTLGATKWQTFKYIYWPYVISRLSDDIRILVGISWTYIIVAELKNVQGGLGSLIFLGERRSDPSIVYAMIILIVILGVLQDRLFKWLDTKLFPFKY